jgi:opacity protein-like surface antigen
VSSSAVYALPPMGPPKALLGQDRVEVGIEYGYRNMDLEAVGKVTDIQVSPEFITVRKGQHNIDNLKSNIVLGRAGYGINDNWDAFVRLGVVNAKGDIERIFPDNATPDKYEGFDGSFGFAAGFGTRATFWQGEHVSWGGLFQMTWEKPDESDISLSGDTNFSGTAEIEIWEVQIAVGPTLRLVDGFCLYGGPFLHFVKGDLELSGQTVDMGSEMRVEASGDIEEKSQFGGYVGASWGASEDIFHFFIELQFTGDAESVGLCTAWRF